MGHILNLVKAQAEAGHDVGVVWIGDQPGTDLNRTPETISKICRAGFLHLPVDQSGPLAKFASRRSIRKQALDFVQERLANSSSDPLILHGHGLHGGDLASYVKKNAGRRKKRIRCVFSPHGTRLQKKKADWPLSLMSPSVQKIVQHSDGILFNSAAYQDYFGEFAGPLPPATALIYDGLGEEEFAPRQIIDMASDFLFYGELNRHTGIETLIKALARMKKHYRTGALIAGSGRHEKELRAQVDRYGLSHEIFFNASLDAKTAFLKGGCLLLPAKLYSIPYIALQAAAVGMPMILTNEGGLPELTQEVNMPRIAANNTDALQKQLIAYLTEPEAFLARAAALRHTVAKRFTLARMCQETEQFYQRLNKAT